MITARATRLVRVADLRAFRGAITALACDGDPLDARDRLVIVPTRAAASHLTRSIEIRRLAQSGGLVLPDLVTRGELYARLGDRLEERPRVLDVFEREALLGGACRAAKASGVVPPFQLRPGLIAEVLDFYDDLRRHENDVDTFERRALAALEPGADVDRGAARLVRQTRFLVAAFRAFEAGCAATGAVDEHGMRDRLRAQPSANPWRHVVVTVLDRAADHHGLSNCDLDLLARLPGLERLDLVVTDMCLAGALHERLHNVLPGLEEVRHTEEGEASAPLLVLPPAGVAHVSRDREEEIAGFAVRVRRLVHESNGPALERAALVVRRPLPYVYLAREVLRSGGVPCQMFDALPLSGEPYAAALDLVFSCVSSNFARGPLVALLRSPHYRFERDGQGLDAREVAHLDRRLSEAGYLGGIDALESFTASAEGAAHTVLAVVRALLPLREQARIADHLGVLLEFLARHEALAACISDVQSGPPVGWPANSQSRQRSDRSSRDPNSPPVGRDDSLHSRHLRARAAILGALHAIRTAHGAHDAALESFDTVAAMVRRWIEGQTFAPRLGRSGVHLVDADSARYGHFDVVQLAGLVESEWPERPRRTIFYSPSVLMALGWPSDKLRIEAARNAFVDLLRLPTSRLLVSTFTLEDDAVVTASPFLDAIEGAGLVAVEEDNEVRPRVFEWEALGLDPVRIDRLAPAAAEWARFRQAAPEAIDPRHRGATTGHAAPALSVSALERYQDCPFKFFAADVLKLEEAPEDEPTLSPRARGRFIHEVFQRFFAEWDQREGGTMTPDRLDAARALFEEAAAPLLARLPAAEAALERARLFGSAIAVGLVDVVLGVEAARPVNVVERWLEHRLDGEFSLGASDERRVSLRGVADRIDLLEGRRLRVIDYKSGYAPNVKRALQVAVYALSAVERLTARDRAPWSVDEAAYVALSGKRTLVPVVKAGASDPSTVLDAARARLVDAVDAIERGEFPPRPHDPMICSYCAYASVCRKDYVGDE